MRKADGDDAVYGVNTGFGNFAETRIDKHDLAALQLNLLRSHAAGVDTPLPVRTVRAAMALRANVLAKGFSGIRVETLEALLALLNRGVHPRVPSRGSVGASGDLAPLAHLALVLVGEGETLDQGSGIGASGSRRRLSGAEALEAPDSHRSRSEPKEGLALINGTQVSTAVLALALAGAERLSRAADIGAALSIDALMGSMHPFEPRIHEPRPFAGQAASADNLLRLLDGSGINASHVNCGRVQDAYSMRCAPQVHGAAREALSWIRHIVDDRDERRDGQPDGVRRIRRDGVGRQLPRRAAGARRRSPSDGRGPAGDDQRAAIGTTGQSGVERAAGVPHRAWRPAIGPDDRAGDGRGADVRD